MGRELKRVALDFDWPLNKVWKGYINPYYEECKYCEGSGSSIAGKRLSGLVNLILLSGSDACDGKCHPYFYDMPLHGSERKVCEIEMAELSTGLAGRKPSFLGHDACDRWTAIKTIIKAAGVSEDWGTCKECNGHGIPKDKYEAYDKWQQEEPPTGEGYQIWETVSEGSPISPVFNTPEKLAKYMSEESCDKGSYEMWLKFINEHGWAPSLIMDSRGVHTGVEAITDNPKGDSPV